MVLELKEEDQIFQIDLKITPKDKDGVNLLSGDESTVEIDVLQEFEIKTKQNEDSVFDFE